MTSHNRVNCLENSPMTSLSKDFSSPMTSLSKDFSCTTLDSPHVLASIENVNKTPQKRHHPDSKENAQESSPFVKFGRRLNHKQHECTKKDPGVLEARKTYVCHKKPVQIPSAPSNGQNSNLNSL
ncbi:hypothetical protein M8J76_013046 [Diaphorina citri]|nr:hypothetical protein M8J76_013046 [Diaphorina citri]